MLVLISPKGLFAMTEIRRKSLSDFMGFVSRRKEVNAMLHKLVKLLSSPSSDSRRGQQFDGRLLDENRENVFALMQQQMSSLR